MRVHVHFSSKFLNINFQYLKTKIYYYSLKTCISSFVEVIEGRNSYSSLPRAPSSVNSALITEFVGRSYFTESSSFVPTIL